MDAMWLQQERRMFSTAPRTSSYFPAEAMEAARRAVHHALDCGTGPSLILGGAGLGKSLLALKIQEHYRATAPLALVSGFDLRSRLELLQSILFGFGLPFRGNQEAELRLGLLDFITSRDATQMGAILVVDDADAVASELLQDLGSLCSHARDGNWCLQLVLLGSTGLDELLASPGLTSLQQRISARCFLAPWTRAETRAFILSEVTRSMGNAPQPFTEPALASIFELTGGIPRLVNQLCEHALLLATVADQPEVDPEAIHDAWSDLQQLPPRHGTPRGGQTGASGSSQPDWIEFGDLPDEESDNHEGNTRPIAPARDAAVVQPQDVRSEQRTSQGAASESPDDSLLSEPVTGATHAPPSPAKPLPRSPQEANPFLERFEQEELIWDGPQTAQTLDLPLVRRQPQVTTREGQVLSAALSAIQSNHAARPPQRDDPAHAKAPGPPEPTGFDPAAWDLHEAFWRQAWHVPQSEVEFSQQFAQIEAELESLDEWPETPEDESHLAVESWGPDGPSMELVDDGSDDPFHGLPEVHPPMTSANSSRPSPASAIPPAPIAAGPAATSPAESTVPRRYRRLFSRIITGD